MGAVAKEETGVALAPMLKKLRMAKRKSLQEVADEVGASKAHIWDLETGRATNPSIDLLTKLSRCFDVSIAELVGETASKDDEPHLLAMYRDLKNLSESDRAAIKTMMEHLRKRSS